MGSIVGFVKLYAVLIIKCCFYFVAWLPFWPYMKLLAFGWLVLPRFSGAGFLYENLRAIFVKNFTTPEGKDDQQPLNPKAEAEGFLSGAKEVSVDDQVNGSTATLEKILDIKDKFVEPKYIAPQTEKKAVAAGEAKEKEILAAAAAAAAADSGEKQVSEMPPAAAASEKVQKRWACPLCQVTTSSEETLISHLRGRKHKDHCCYYYYSYGGQKEWACGLCQVTTTCEENLKSHLRGRKHKNKLEELNAEKGDFWENKSKLWCSICDVACPGITSMASHLKGEKHLAQVQFSKISSG